MTQCVMRRSTSEEQTIAPKRLTVCHGVILYTLEHQDKDTKRSGHGKEIGKKDEVTMCQVHETTEHHHKGTTLS